jgi:peptide/nickel transport system ATP-binding protein
MNTPTSTPPVPPISSLFSPPLLQVENLQRDYTLPREHLWKPSPVVHALQGVSLTVQTGRSLGVVGESGSGKSTLARLVMALERPTSGSVKILGQDLSLLNPADLRAARRHFQMVFQDPFGSLDPRQTVAKIVAEPLAAQGKTSASASRSQVAEVLVAVGLRERDLDKFAHEFSGGQRQRIAIARALVTRPQLIVADEPVSALDASVQAQVLNLMQDLQQQFGVTYLLISHDLAVVNHLCDELAVMFQGRIVEQAAPQTLFHHAQHPYTKALLNAVPHIDLTGALGPRRRSVATPVRAVPATACPYAHRCPLAQAQCDASAPQLKPQASQHQVACHLV